MINFKVGLIPGEIKNLSAEAITIKEAVEIAGFDLTNKEVRLNGTLVTDLEAPVPADGQIYLTQKVKGN